MKNKISITLDFTLADWSDSLSFKEITDTLFIVGNYLNNPESTQVSKTDKLLISNWLKNNDINKFLDAKDAATLVHAIEQENQYYAKEIMSIKYKKPASH